MVENEGKEMKKRRTDRHKGSPPNDFKLLRYFDKSNPDRAEKPMPGGRFSRDFREKTT